MNVSMRRTHTVYEAIIIILLILSFGALFWGCTSSEAKKAKHLANAKKYVNNLEYKKAVIEYKNVIQIDPRDSSSYFELGEVYLKLKRGREAFQSFSRAAELDPENLEAHIKVGDIHLLSSNTDEARKRAELVLSRNPDHVDGLMLLSGVQVKEQHFDEAIQTLEKAARLDPSRVPVRLALGRLLMRNGKFEMAENHYKEALDQDPHSFILRIEISRLYMNMGRQDDAERELKNLVANSTDNRHASFIALGRFYEETKDWKHAEKNYQEAIKIAPENNTGPLMNLAYYYTRRKAYDAALNTMKQAAELNGEDLGIQAAIAQLHLAFNHVPEAQETAAEILKKDKEHPGANLILGRLLLNKRQFAEAVSHLDIVVRNEPRMSDAYYFRALSLLGKKEKALARKDLVKTVDLNPRHIHARLMLAETYLLERNLDLARGEIDKVLALDPHNIRALLYDGNLALLEKRPLDAEKRFKEVIKLSPKNPTGYTRLGFLYFLQKKRKEALKQFSGALQLQPGLREALTYSVLIYLDQKRFDKALEFCDRQKRGLPDGSISMAFLHDLKGRIHLVNNKYTKAKEDFERAIEIDSNILFPYSALAKIALKQGNEEAAISNYKQMISKRHSYLPAHMSLGVIYQQRGDIKEAESHYREALAIRKNFAPAANNLAWILTEHGGNIDEALNLAQTAKEYNSKDPSIMDTLGWIYYKKGLYPSAIAELEQSREKMPANPTVLYHLGMSYLKNNQEGKAREALRKALELDKDFPGSQDAERVLRDGK